MKYDPVVVEPRIEFFELCRVLGFCIVNPNHVLFAVAALHHRGDVGCAFFGDTYSL